MSKSAAQVFQISADKNDVTWSEAEELPVTYVIYKTLVVLGYEQFSATIVDSKGVILDQKVLWSEQAVVRWAERKAPNAKGIKYESVFGKPKSKN